jgi:trans-aconitate methyltransferase
VGQKSFYEFGCGTGHNLIRAREQFPELDLWGLDWARSSQELINKIALDTGDKKLHSHHFDYFNPDSEIRLDSNAAVFTIASLEQTGEDFIKFIDYLLANEPQIVVHVEPIGEMLNPRNLLDNLSVRYFRKRRYLNGLATHLEDLASQGRIEIVQKQRSFVGSFYIDGYSIIAWRPV